MSRVDCSKLNVAEKGFRFEPFRPSVKNESPLYERDHGQTVKLHQGEDNVNAAFSVWLFFYLSKL